MPTANRLTCLLLLALAAGPAAAADVTVFAAASTTSAVSEAAELFAATHGARVRTVFASSSTLARQIANGAPADLFISANVRWMDFVEGEKAIDAGSRVDLLGNRLVLVAPVDRAFTLTIAAPFPLAARLAGGWLAMGDPDHVPAGIYGRAALQHLGAWPSVAPMVARAQDVRAALALVERGEAVAGIVYATDAAISAGVRLIDTFPADSHPRIVYPMAVVAGRGRPEVRQLHEFLASPAAARVFVRHGFTAPP